MGELSDAKKRTDLSSKQLKDSLPDELRAMFLHEEKIGKDSIVFEPFTRSEHIIFDTGQKWP